MVGIFQLFGLSFVFWSVVGCLRFISDTLQARWRASHEASNAGLFIAAAGGLVVTFALLFLFFLNFNPSELLELTLLLLTATLSLWLASVAFGSYFAARLYVYEPYTVSMVVNVAAIVIGTKLFSDTAAGLFLAPQTPTAWVLWGGSTLLVGLLGGHIARAMNTIEKAEERVREEAAHKVHVRPEEVAVLIAAHNEELTIGATIEALKRFTTIKHIYVGSDGSRDKTVEVVRKLGVYVDDIQPNRGKAGALTYVLENQRILERYKAVFFIDAEIKPDANFYAYALPQFDDPSIVAIIGHAKSLWPEHYLPRWKYFFTAYRTRLWRVLQYALRYGQTWKYTNVSPIVPGGGSIYRTSALKHIKIHVPGLIIEDFNMTFSIHHQRLGKIAFDPRAYVMDQEPYSLRDYTKQVFRWYLGFFQTVRHHGIWPSWFCLALVAFTLELLVGSIFFLFVPLVLIFLLLNGNAPLSVTVGPYSVEWTLLGLLVMIFIIDYIVTITVALIERKPLLLLYGLAFFLLRYLETWIFLYALVKGLFTKQKNDGRWVSPKRIAYSATSGA